MLRVLTRLVALEPAQATMLARIVEGATLDADELMGSGALTEGSAGSDEGPEDEESNAP